MGWNDHLADPDAWEAYIDAAWDKADMDRKRAKEDALFRGTGEEVTIRRENATSNGTVFTGRSYDGKTFYLGDDTCDCESYQ